MQFNEIERTRNEYELIGELAFNSSTTSKTKPRIPNAFDNGRMNQRIWSGLAVTLMTTALGTATSGYAQQTQAVDQGSEGSRSTAQVQPRPITATVASDPSPVRPTDVMKVGELQSQSATAVPGEVIAKIHAYESAGRQAVTLYVRSIPVLTFLGLAPIAADGIKMGEAPSGGSGIPQNSYQKSASRNQVSEDTTTIGQPSAASDTLNRYNDPVWRATAVAARLNQLNRDNVDAKAIAASWNAECNCYSIKVNNQELVRINDSTILPDTTKNPAEDALQATNRLRRLMGNAPPLREIAGKPSPRRPATAQVSLGPIRLRLSGVASWYGPGFHGNRSASGEIYNQNAMTAAHKSLPFGTAVQVTNLDNGRSVVVRINDRGPYIHGRVIDLSAAAARVLGLMQTGIAPVQLEVLNDPQRVAADSY